MAFPRLLSILANKLNSLGQVPLTTAVGAVTGVLPTINGGTNVSVAGASGNILTSDGTNWTSVPPAPVASGASYASILKFL